MSTIVIGYTPSGGSPVYSFTFSEFTESQLSRTYQGTATFSQSANGASIITGAPSRQKYIWAISSPVPKTDAISFDAMFQAWDTDRANGLSAAVTVTDSTFGTSVVTNAVISTPPSYERWTPSITMVSFGLTEV